MVIIFDYIVKIDLPKEDLEIVGSIQGGYNFDEPINVTCKSSESKPPANMTWYINDKMVIKFI